MGSFVWIMSEAATRNNYKRVRTGIINNNVPPSYRIMRSKQFAAPLEVGDVLRAASPPSHFTTKRCPTMHSPEICFIRSKKGGAKVWWGSGVAALLGLKTHHKRNTQ